MWTVTDRSTDSVQARPGAPLTPVSSVSPVPDRMYVAARAAAAALACIAVLWAILPDRLAVMLLDYPSQLFIFPFTVQTFEHLAFFIALGEIYVRRKTVAYEEAFLAQRFLPEDDETVLQAQDLGPIRRRVARLSDGEHGFLPGLIDLCVLQFQASRSVDQTVSVLNSSLELLAHRVDLRYQALRYLVWFIPTLGFLGTVIGIGSTLALVPEDGKADLFLLSQNLTVAFDTTIVALAESAVLVFAMNMVQAREERAVSQAGMYCLRNLINRLYTG
jgi:biopolymer transport protein ExbB/TolQ